MHPDFKGKQILVSEEKLIFDSYCVQADRWPPLPHHLRLAAAGKCGDALYCNVALAQGKVVLEEEPLMLCRNTVGLPSRYNLFNRMLKEQGQSSPAVRAFQELSDGGVSNKFETEATAIFKDIIEGS